MTNLLILSLQLLFQIPTNNFTAYYDLTEIPSWVASSNMCLTALIKFEGPPGVYEVWWSNTTAWQLPVATQNGWNGQEPLRIGDRIVHLGGQQTVAVAVVPEPMGSFRLKKYLSMAQFRDPPHPLPQNNR